MLGMQLKRHCATGIQLKGPNNGSVPEHSVPRMLCWVEISLCLGAASCERNGMDRRREGKWAPVSRASAEADRMFESTRSPILNILPKGGEKILQTNNSKKERRKKTIEGSRRPEQRVWAEISGTEQLHCKSLRLYTTRPIEKPRRMLDKESAKTFSLIQLAATVKEKVASSRRGSSCFLEDEGSKLTRAKYGIRGKNRFLGAPSGRLPLKLQLKCIQSRPTEQILNYQLLFFQYLFGSCDSYFNTEKKARVSGQGEPENIWFDQPIYFEVWHILFSVFLQISPF